MEGTRASVAHVLEPQAAGASTKREKTPQMIMRLVREKVQKNTAFKESTLAPTPQLLAGRIYIH
jgi:hypothetical protein